MVEIYVMLQAKTVGAVSPSWGSTLSWGPADQAAKASLTNNGVSGFVAAVAALCVLGNYSTI